MTFMKLPDEEAIVMAWADSSKAIGYVKKVPVRYSVSQMPHPSVQTADYTDTIAGYAQHTHAHDTLDAWISPVATL